MYNKMIEYQRKVASINNKINILSENGYDVSEYQETIKNIVNTCDNSVSTISQGNMQVQVKNMDADANYDCALKNLKNLENIIDNENKYIKLKISYEEIIKITDIDEIDDDNFKELDRVLSMGTYELSKLRITDLEKSKYLIELLYKACYHVIKLEIRKYGYSNLLVKINNLEYGCEFLNNEIKKDINTFDLEDESNADIKNRINELSKNGLDANLCDFDLILRMIIRDYPKLKWDISSNYIEVSENIKSNNYKITSKNNQKTERMKLQKNQKKSKILAACSGIITTLVVFSSIKFNNNLEDNKNLYSEGVYSKIEVYDSESNSISNKSEYKIKDSDIVIYDYGSVNDNNKREVKTYKMNTNDLDISDIAKIDTNDLVVDSEKKIKYDDTQISKDAYKVIEKVIDRDDTNTKEILDEKKVNKHSKLVYYCTIFTSSILGICFGEVISNRKKYKENDKEIKELAESICELMKENEENKYLEKDLSRANDIVKTIHAPYESKRK